MDAESFGASSHEGWDVLRRFLGIAIFLVTALACGGAASDPVKTVEAAPDPSVLSAWKLGHWKTNTDLTSTDGRFRLSLFCGFATIDTAAPDGGYPFATKPATAKLDGRTLGEEIDNFEGSSHLLGLDTFILAGGDRLVITGVAAGGEPLSVEFQVTGASQAMALVECPTR